MSLTITTRMESDRVILDLSGRVVFLETSLRDSVRDLLVAGHRNFVLNFTDVTHLDSFGMGQLVSILTSVQNRNGTLMLLRPNEYVQKLLRTTRLDTVFQIEKELVTT